jgi:hypothetical protein
MRRITKWLITIPSAIILIPVVLLIVAATYQAYQVHQAEGAVATAATGLAHGNLVSGLTLQSSVDRSDLSRAFASGYTIAGFDNIGLSFNAYEIKVRVANGDQYNFDAYESGGEWHLSCCTRWSAAELH